MTGGVLSRGLLTGVTKNRGHLTGGHLTVHLNSVVDEAIDQWETDLMPVLDCVRAQGSPFSSDVTCGTVMTALNVLSQ